MSCDFPERHGPLTLPNGRKASVHCAWCLTHPEFKLNGAACPNRITLEMLPLGAAQTVVYKKGCADCRNRARQHAKL